MSIPERIWVILFTAAEGAVPFLCYFYQESFSYGAMLFFVPVGMAFLYICLFGKERPFETDITGYAMFQATITAMAAFFALVFLQMNLKNSNSNFQAYMILFLILGAVFTIFLDDIIFALIFIIIGRIYGMESIFSKQKKKHEEFYKKDSQPYGGYRNIYEKMYWEELERRQREEFKRKNFGWRMDGASWESEWNKKEAGKAETWEEKEEFLFENTRFFKSISSMEQVRKRYISLMKKYHPDMPGGSKELTQEIQMEYDKICQENHIK